MTLNQFSRRRLLQTGAAAAAGVTAVPVAALARAAQEEQAKPESLFQGDADSFRTSLQNAYLFLDTMMDAYAQGSTTRLSQSYSDDIGLESTAFVYDNAVEIMARLLRGLGQDLARAEVLGYGLLYAQQIDPAADGRVRQAYFVDHPDSTGAFIVPSGFPFFFQGSATGDLAWTGMSQDNIPEDVQDWSLQAFLNSDHAASIDWCKTNLAVTDTPQTYNSDLVPMLNNNNLTGNIRVSGVTFATQSMRPPLAENENAESACFMAPSDPFSNQPSPSAVWLEGTGHLAAALLTRRLPRNRDIDGFNGDVDTARILLDNIRVAQNNLGKGQHVGGGQPFIGLGRPAQTIPDGLGVIAATSELNTGFGFSYKRFLHIGATGWYAIAGQTGNPFRLGLGQTG